MKKIFSLVLIFVLSITMYSSLDVKAEATSDVTVTFHIHQFDGDYTNTGLGIWDGVNWNGWADVATVDDVTTTDGFGAVITKTFAMADVNNDESSADDKAFLDEIQVKPSRNAAEDNAANYLAPASQNGEVYLDVTSLKDGSATELHVYYVEGAKDFYVAENDNGLFFNVFAIPKVALYPDAYDGWGMHTWANGEGGSSADYDANNLQYQIEMEVPGVEYTMEMRLGVLEVATGATANSGFIAHVGGNDGEKSCSTDMTYDGASLLDAENGNGAMVKYYEYQQCEFAADYDAFITSVEANYDFYSSNQLMNGMITAPNKIEFDMAWFKLPTELQVDRFSVLLNGNALDIVEVNPGQLNISDYESSFEVGSERYVRIFLETDVPHDEIAMVGNFQGWSPENGVMSTGDYMGYAVFEVSTDVAEMQYVFLHNPNEDDPLTEDVDESVFTWDHTKISGGDNVVIDLTGLDTYSEIFLDETDTQAPAYGFEASDLANYTLVDPADGTTPVDPLTCDPGANVFTLVLKTGYDHTRIGMVGSIQEPNEWTPGEAITVSALTEEGYPVIQTCSTKDVTAYKVLFDADDNGFNWGDYEIVNVDTELNWAGATDSAKTDLLVDLSSHEPTITVTNIYRLSIYLDTDMPAANFGIVGNFTGWDAANPVLATGTDDLGNPYFDIQVNTRELQYGVLYNADPENVAWDWPLKISETFSQAEYSDGNILLNLGENTSYITVITTDGTADNFTLASNPGDYQALQTKAMSIVFADDSLAVGDLVEVTYIETPASEGVEEYTISTQFDTVKYQNGLALGDSVTMSGSWAPLPNMIKIALERFVPADTVMSVMMNDGTNDMDLSGMTVVGNKTCEAGYQSLTVYLENPDGIEDLTTVGLVGSVQQSGWDATAGEEGEWTNAGWTPATAINPVRLDADGNFVFEICVETMGKDAADAADDILAHEFKVLLNDGVDNEETTEVDESGFNWGDEEISIQVAVTFVDSPISIYVKGEDVTAVKQYFMYELAEGSELVTTNTYTLTYLDASGFYRTTELLIDNEGPVVDYNQLAGKDLEIDNDETTFDVSDYFGVLRFVDNYDGEVDYVVTQDLDLAVIGEQTVILTATDTWGNVTTQEFVFTVNDVIAPVITLDDAPSFESGTTAPDWNDYITVNEGTISINESQVDMDTAGEFFVQYTVTDAAGNSSNASLKVTITAAPEPEPETGCFGGIGNGSVLVVIAGIAALGSLALFVSKRK